MSTTIPAPQLLPFPIMFDGERLALRRARAPLHILLVDDDPVTGMLIRNALGSAYSITVCENVGDALNEYARLAPDLVFLDIDLSDKHYNGLDVLRTIHTIDPSANVVMLSGHDTPPNIAYATFYGACGFMAKPFDIERLRRYARECEQMKQRQERLSWM